MTKHWWAQYPWRNIQTNLREIDMRDIDAKKYVDSMKAMHASVAMINFGGIIASYQTALEDQTQSSFLTGDSLQTIVRACHDAGIRVIARMDFSKIREAVYARHPDWAYRDKKGQIVNYNGDVHACINGGYQQEYVYRIMREVLENFDIDAVFFNMGGFKENDYSYHYHGPCHCANCKRLFKEQYGYDIPDKNDMENPVWRKYLLFKEEIVEFEKKRMADFIHSIKPDVAVDLFDIGRCESNTEYKRPLPFFQYSSSSNTRMLRAIDNKLVPSNTSVDFVGYFYRHVAVSAAQQKLRIYQALANRGGLDYYLMSRLDNHLDRTGFAGVKEVFRFHEAHENVYTAQLDSMAKVLLLKTRFWDVFEEERGWVRALTESHVPFDEAQEQDLLTSSIDKYETLIIPEIHQLSSQSIGKLTSFAENGGTVIIVGESGKYDERYEETRNPFGKLLGIDKVDLTRKDMVSSMFMKETKDAVLFPSMTETDVLMTGDNYTYCTYQDAVEKHLDLIPPHMYGPPERCYFTQITTLPGMTINSIGKGKGIFIPWQPGTLYYREGYDNPFFFMHDVVCTVAGMESIAPDTTKMVEVTYQKEHSNKFFLVQLINGSGHFGTSYFDPIPIQKIAIAVETPKKITKVQSLQTGQDLPFEIRDGKVFFQLPILKDFECVVLS